MLIQQPPSRQPRQPKQWQTGIDKIFAWTFVIMGALSALGTLSRPEPDAAEALVAFIFGGLCWGGIVAFLVWLYRTMVK